MLRIVTNNIRFLKRYLFKKFSISRIATEDPSISIESVKMTQTSSNKEIGDKNMSPAKSLAFFAAKFFIILILINLFFISPIKKSISSANEAFNKNVIIKIFAMDLISNPLTCIRIAEYYKNNGKDDQARLFIEYGQTLAARYSYPKELNQRLAKLKESLLQK